MWKISRYSKYEFIYECNKWNIDRIFVKFIFYPKYFKTSSILSQINGQFVRIVLKCVLSFVFLSEPCLLRLWYVWKLRCTFSRCSSSMCLLTLCYLSKKKKCAPLQCSKRKNPVWYKRVQDYKLRRKLFIQLERGPALYIYPYLDMLFPWCIRNDEYLAINSTS